MKNIERILDMMCVICTVIFFGAVTVMVLAQAFAVVSLNGALSAELLNRISQPAGIVSAAATVIAIILAYMRGQMKS